MRILFWIGYSNPHWDKGTWENKGIGGSEYCVLKLADYLDLKGHDVTITGDVKNGDWYGVKYTHHTQLKQNEHYDVVIAISYLHYLKHLAELNITFDKNFFWMHNEFFYKWYRGNEMDDWADELDKVDKIVGVSKYHIDIIKAELKALDYTPPRNDTYIHSIDNAIDLNDYKGLPNVERIKNRIIGSSSPDRGLKMMLDNWTKWRALVPDLTLEICCPPYAVDWFNEDISNLEGVNWQGNRSPRDLKIEILKSEYWIYASDYLETYCISCLEMMMGGVRIITNGTGNIMNLIGNGDRGVICDMNPDTIIKTIMNTSDDTWREKTTNAYEWAVKQNWDNRVNEWLRLIDNTEWIQYRLDNGEYVWDIGGKKTVRLDQFYSKPEVASEMINLFHKTVDMDLSEYIYVEPSAGDGVILEQLPIKRRIGIDLEPKHDEIIECDFLKWVPNGNKKYVTIGNPPFGLRGNAIVEFIKRASKFSDVIGFSVPEYFSYNMDGWEIVCDEKLNDSKYRLADSSEVLLPIGLRFQVWRKIINK